MGAASGKVFLMVNQGMCLETGSSRRSLPASRSCITPMLVNSFEMEQML